MGLDLDDVKDGDDKEEEVEEVESEVTEISTTPDDSPGIVKPVENIDEVVGMYEQFEEIKNQLLDEDKDLTSIGNGVHVNKSGWRKIATAFNISTEIVDKGVWSDENGIIHAEVEAKATAPNGKSTSGAGMCSSNESNFAPKLGSHPEFSDPDDSDRIVRVDNKWRVLPQPKEVNHHNLLAIAETRAKNRAISDLVGGGEVSAEEMGTEFFMD